MNLATGRKPKVGDEIVYSLWEKDEPQEGRLYLAIRVGEDGNTRGSQIWLAWNDMSGILTSVSVGKWWIVKRKKGDP